MLLDFPFPQISHIGCWKHKVFSTSVCNFGNSVCLFLKQGGTTHIKVANYSLPWCHFLPQELQLIYLLFKSLSGDNGRHGLGVSRKLQCLAKCSHQEHKNNSMNSWNVLRVFSRYCFFGLWFLIRKVHDPLNIEPGGSQMTYHFSSEKTRKTYITLKTQLGNCSCLSTVWQATTLAFCVCCWHW